VPPDTNHQYGFNFNTYGVRVPAVIVSPYIPAGSRIRATPRPIQNGPPYPFDHTSIIVTVRKLFNLGASLTERDKVAPDLVTSLSLALPTNDGPPRIGPPVIQPSAALLQTRAAAPLNGMQRSLSAAAANLPLSPPATPDDIPPPTAIGQSTLPTVATAGANAITRTKLFLGV
jgi:phospholipase C